MNKIFVYLVVLFMTQSVILNFKKNKKPIAFKWPNISILFFNLTLNILSTFEFFGEKGYFLQCLVVIVLKLRIKALITYG